MRQQHVRGIAWSALYRPLIALIPIAFWCIAFLAADAAWAAAPAAPTNLTATAASSKQINLAWTDNATNETNYYVERSPNGSSSWTVVATLAANTTSYQNTGLTQNTKYYYRVRCAAGSTYSSYSSTANATTAALAGPTSLTATMAASNKINLAWTDNTAYETQYSIERSPNGSSSWTVLGTVATNVTTTTNSGLTAATAYYYRVRAYDGTNYSAYSNTANATTGTIAAPTALTATIASATQIALSWTDNTAYETQYSIERSPNGSSSWTVLGTVASNVTTTTNSGLTAGTAYYYRVRAYDGTNYSAYSNTANQTIRTITASAGTNGAIAPSGTVGVANGATQVFTMTPNGGYQIATVTVDSTSVATSPTYTFPNVTANHTISATFSVATYTIIASAGPNGSISPSGAVAVPGGTNEVFTITPNSGYKIDTMTVDGSAVATSPTYTFTNVTASHTISAMFSANTFTITATAGANGSMSPSGAVIVSSGATPTFTATPNQGYRILDVQVDSVSVGSAPTYTFTPVTANHSISASFTALTYTITSAANPNGSISPSGTMAVSYGANQSYTMTPNSGYHVSDVLVDGVSFGAVGLYTFSTVTSSHSITASFSNTYAITASAGPNGSISPSGSVVVSSGTSTTFTIAPNANYHVSDVLVDGASVGPVASYLFSNVTATHAISASFASDAIISNGTITTDTVWTRANSPYIVTGSVVVAGTSTTPATLTIEPGVVVRFASNAGLYIGNGTSLGALVSRGTSTNRITFTRNGTSGTWPGITFSYSTVSASTTIEYTDVQYLASISMTATSPTIKDSTITYSSPSSYGLYLSNSSPNLDHVTATGDALSVIYLYSNSSPTISGGSYTNTSPSGQGIVADYGSYHPSISNCAVTITDTPGKYGLYLKGATSALSITNSTISNGLYVTGSSISPTISGNTFSNLDNSPIHASSNMIGTIVANNTLTGLTSAGRIEVDGSNSEVIKQDARWIKLQAPYVVTSGSLYVYKDATSASTLTIDPGVTIQFPVGGQLYISGGTNYKGALIARGTPSDRITFDRSGTSGTWAGVTFDSGTVTATSMIEYADILNTANGIQMTSTSPTIKDSSIAATSPTSYGVYLYASNPTLNNVSVSTGGLYGLYLYASSPTITGGSITNTNATGCGICTAYGTCSSVISSVTVSVVNAPGNYGIKLGSWASASLSITNSTIGNGLFINSYSGLPTITGNTFTNLDNSPIHAGANIIDQILNNNTLSGLTSAGSIEVPGEQVSHDALWKKWAAPYNILQSSVNVYKDTTTSATLTIEPGAVLKFASNTGLYIGAGSYKGVMSAVGTAADKIRFTSSGTTTAGSWTGITLTGAAASASVIDNAIVENGGAGGAYNQANIVLTSASPAIRRTSITNSAGSGIYLTSASTAPIIDSCTVSSNKWGIYSNSSNPTVSNSIISGNPTAGIYNYSPSTVVDARNNWWGSATGPTYSGNPGGTGDAVTAGVLYSPWLTQQPGTSSVTINNVQALPASLNQYGDFTVISGTISEDALWTVVIADSSQNQIKHISGSGVSVRAVWYGDNDQGQKVPDGAYYYWIDAVTTAWGVHASSPQGLLAVSSQLPIAIFTNPAENQLFAAGATIAVSGTASDSTDFWYYILEYGPGTNPATWTQLKYSTVPVSNGLIWNWDTTGLTGTDYTVRLTVTDTANNVGVETAHIRLLAVTGQAASEPYISPNDDGVKDTSTISANITYAANWTVTIKNGSGTAVRTYTGTGTAIAQVWDGKNASGQVVTDGVYTYQIDAVSTETAVAALPKTGSLTADTTPPTAQITAPAANAPIYSTVSVIGSATDTNFSDYRVEYGPAAGNGPWSTITSTVASPVSGGTLATWVTNDSTNNVILQNGAYALRLVASDKAGNSSTAVIPVNADNLILTGVGASSNTIDTSTLQTISAFYTINSAATVTLKIVPEKQGPGGTPVYQAAQAATGGAGMFTWDGKDNTGKAVPDEAYLYILEAGDGTRSDSYSPPAATGTATASCSPSSGFDPWKNIPMTVTYTPSQPARVDINIYWWAASYKVLDAAPATTAAYAYVWDGRSPGGKLLDRTAYASCSVASLLRENFLITTGDAIKPTDVKTDPYNQVLSYGQHTRILYTLPRDANVTVTLTAPSGSVTTLLNNQLQTAGTQSIEWNGLDASDPTGKRAVFSQEGDFMVSVRAVNPATGTAATTRANVKVGY